MSLLTDAANAAFLPRGEPAAAAVPEGEQQPRSALVVGWFYASERELNYVRKIYRRNGEREPPAARKGRRCARASRAVVRGAG